MAIFGPILGHIWDPLFEVVPWVFRCFGLFWVIFGSKNGSKYDLFWVILGSFWVDFDPFLGHFWVTFWVILGPILTGFGHILGSFLRSYFGSFWALDSTHFWVTFELQI